MYKSHVFSPVVFLVDIIFIPIVFILFILAYPFKLFSKRSLRFSTRFMRFLGFFLFFDHYYNPRIKFNKLDYPFSQPRTFASSFLVLSSQISLLQKLNFANEFDDLVVHSSMGTSLKFADTLANGAFGSGDAEFLYQFVRFTNPSRVIEIGSGSSTTYLSAALQRNNSVDIVSQNHICYEPYEHPWLSNLPINLIRKRIETISPYDIADTLSAGDLLFIDSSHMIRPQGDVLFLFLEVLPLLKSGTYIHIHDIFTPRDYQYEWHVNNGLFWNEQYLVESILVNSNRYRVVAALNYLKYEAYDSLKLVCPYINRSREPGSLYIQVL